MRGPVRLRVVLWLGMVVKYADQRGFEERW